MSIRGGVPLWGGVSAVPSSLPACLVGGNVLSLHRILRPCWGGRVIRLSRGVMVAQQVLVLFVKVRILARQQLGHAMPFFYALKFAFPSISQRLTEI